MGQNEVRTQSVHGVPLLRVTRHRYVTLPYFFSIPPGKSRGSQSYWAPLARLFFS